MLVALGPKLQRLTLCDCWGHRYHARQCDLVPAMLAHCPLLAHLAVDCLGLGKNPAVSVMTFALHSAMLCKMQQMVCSAGGNHSCKVSTADGWLSWLQRLTSAQLTHCTQLRLTYKAEVCNCPHIGHNLQS